MHFYVSNKNTEDVKEGVSSIDKKLKRMNMNTALLAFWGLGLSLAFTGVNLRLNSFIASLTLELTPEEILAKVSIDPWVPVILMVIGVFFLIFAPVLSLAWK